MPMAAGLVPMVDRSAPNCTHGTTHAHIARCTIKVAAAEGFYFIYVLRTHAAAQCKGRERYGIFEFHNLLVYDYLCNSPVLVS